MGDRDDEPKRYELTDGERAANGVYTVVADCDGVSETDLPPLAESIDPDALNRLLASGSETNQVVFTYAGYEIAASPKWVHVEESTE